MPVAAKYALAVFHPFTVASLRFGLAVAILLPLIWRRRELSWKMVSHLWPVALFGALNPIILFIALQFTQASFSPLIYASLPALTALYLVAVDKRQVERQAAAGIVVGLLGVGLIVLLPFFESGVIGFSVFGNVLIFVAALSFLMYGIVSKKKQSQLKISPLALTFYFCVMALVISAPLTIWELWRFGVPQDVSFLQWLSAVWAGLVGTSIFYLLYQHALKIGGEISASLFTYLQPIFGIGLAALVLGETITPAFVVGGMMALIGAGLASRVKNSR